VKTASYFSGIGGMDLGLHKAGFDIVSQCEKDDFRREVLAARFPGSAIYEDISEVYYGEPEGGSSSGGFLSTEQNGRKAWAGLSGSIDLLCGGFPCQDLSVAGRRAGLAGERSGLFYEFARIADESVRDGGYVLIENVPGLFSSNKGEDFRIVLNTLYECGFNDIAWRTLNSQYFGVPQRRRRIFILGRRSGGRSAGQILLEPESGNWNSEPSSKKGQKDSRVSLSGFSGGGPDDNDAQAGRLVYVENSRDEVREMDVSPALQKSSHVTRQAPVVVSTLQAHKNGYRLDADSIEQFVPVAFNWQTGGDFRLMLGDTAPALQKSQTVAIARPLSSRNERYDFETETFVAETAEYMGVRRLTPRECERLQGLPDDWTAVNGASDTKRYGAIGDAVTVPVAEWIGRRILEHE
jgi:DNA (cytosine-5)-methyltransferase 1